MPLSRNIASREVGCLYLNVHSWHLRRIETHLNVYPHVACLAGKYCQPVKPLQAYIIISCLLFCRNCHKHLVHQCLE